MIFFLLFISFKVQEELEDEEFPGPFTYQNSVRMKNVPYVGTLATYKGGGYAMLTRRDMCRTNKVSKLLHLKTGLAARGGFKSKKQGVLLLFST